MNMNWNRDYAGKHSATVYAVATGRIGSTNLRGRRDAEYFYTATRITGAWRLAVLDAVTLTAIAYHTDSRLSDVVAIAARHDAATDDERRSIRMEFRSYIR
jgi:urease accessory protein UreF